MLAVQQRVNFSSKDVVQQAQYVLKILIIAKKLQ